MTKLHGATRNTGASKLGIIGHAIIFVVEALEKCPALVNNLIYKIKEVDQRLEFLMSS